MTGQARDFNATGLAISSVLCSVVRTTCKSNGNKFVHKFSAQRGAKTTGSGSEHRKAAQHAHAKRGTTASVSIHPQCLWRQPRLAPAREGSCSFFDKELFQESKQFPLAATQGCPVERLALAADVDVVARGRRGCMQ